MTFISTTTFIHVYVVIETTRYRQTDRQIWVTIIKTSITLNFEGKDFKLLLIDSHSFLMISNDFIIKYCKHIVKYFIFNIENVSQRFQNKLY